MSDAPDEEFWSQLRTTTQARIGLGRTGDSLPTQSVLELKAAHAAARDAVHVPLDVETFSATISQSGLGEPLVVSSKAGTRSEYLRRPDLGRAPGEMEQLPHGEFDLVIVLADGLSPRALVDHAPGLLSALVDQLDTSMSLAPLIIATQARVGLGDHIADRLGAQSVLVIIGERPGLSVADSLGIYLTYGAEPGRRDSERNCISNIHPPDGQSYQRAAAIAVALLAGARELGRSGVDLKDTSVGEAVEAAEQAALSGSLDPS